MQHLQPNTTLQGGKYRIERVLGQGGFGNTYVGVNTVFNERIAIKEFFMQGINDRDDATGSITISIERNKQQFQEQLEKFKKEALRIRKLNNPHIVKVHDLFEENGTAYYIMDYVDGENLAERLKRTGKPITEQEVREILPQILDALKTVHDAGMWHLDLKPANIMVDKAGNVKLIDFGASKQLNTQKGGATTSTAISYTNGYAPREQMEKNYDKFGPWTDIYALGATLYNLLTNKRPPLPTDIDDDISGDKHFALSFPESVSNDLKSSVLWMMKTNRLQRPQSIDAIKTAEKDRKDTPKTNTVPQSSTQRVDPNDEETLIVESQSQQVKNETAIPYIADNSSVEERDSLGNDDEGLKNGRILLIIVGIVLGIVIAVWLFFYYTSYVRQNDGSEVTEVSQIDDKESKSETILEPINVNTARKKFNKSNGPYFEEKNSDSSSASSNKIYISKSSRILKTTYSDYKLITIDLRKDKTVLTKVVIYKIVPNDGGSSNKDEYIMDCETGEKYYILNSSLGFEKNPNNYVYKKGSEIIIEEYPPLPLSVNRITVSAGYKGFEYVSNFKLFHE